MELFLMDITSCWRRVALTVLLLGAVATVWPSTCAGQRVDSEKNITGILNGAETFQRFFLTLAKTVTGTGIFNSRHPVMSVTPRTPVDVKVMLADVKRKMERLLTEKEVAVKRLKEAAQQAIKNYGPYKEPIDFKEVDYFNAKKLVTDKDIADMDEQLKEDIKKTITYLPTEPTWDFKEDDKKPLLNSNTSSIHVPTNIYDKSVQILNGVQWSTNLTDQFVQNKQEDPTLTWQYFCSSDGFFRIYPAMQWPREANRLDTFDCRIRKWYIQAASSPKNILILLDSSGSMKGLRFAIARSTVNKILETLSDEDYFNVIAFSEEPRYVDECFNDTLISASVDNIKRIQEKIDSLEALRNANFEKALTKAFKLFKKEHLEYHDHCLCNKAVMIITDGAPENFDSIFDEFNWPNKTVRVFTFLIGKEVPDNRQTRWMACANKGLFTHISTRADVQENVQKYIKVLSRPLATSRFAHQVWSPAYLDYVTEQSEIKVPRGKPENMDVDFDTESVYEGLGLVISISMPVYDERERVNPLDKEPEKSLLGVVGTDVRINELMKFIPDFKLGLNGYAFAITNHGYVLFHPDYTPFYRDKKGSDTGHLLKVRPKYNSIELSEVELTNYTTTGWNKDHPLRRYLLTSKSGGHNMTAVTIMTHSDGMRRARERRNHYQYMEIANTFRLVFVIPDGYGTHIIKVENSSVPSQQQVYEDLIKADQGILTLSNWIFCYDEKTNSYTSLDIYKLMDHLEHGNLFIKCDEEHMKRLLADINITGDYAKVWKGSLTNLPQDFQFFFKNEYNACWSSNTNRKNDEEKAHCFAMAHLNFGIGYIWIGTSTGLTRHIVIDELDPHWYYTSSHAIKSSYYKVAVDGWEDGYRFVFSGPVVNLQKDFKINDSFVTISTAEIVGQNKSAQMPAAVVAFNMKYSAFYSKFVQYLFQCQDASCPYTCNDTEHFQCFLVDSSGYILATNNPDKNGTGMLLGQQNGRLMRALLDDSLFKQLQLTDYQSICETHINNNKDSASNFIKNPFKTAARFFFWVLTEVVIFVSQWTTLVSSQSAAHRDSSNNYKLKECGDTIPEPVARFIYCDYVVGKEHDMDESVVKMRACIQTINRYQLNLGKLLARPRQKMMASCADQCAATTKRSYEALWLNDTNLVFIVADTSCVCNSSNAASDENTSTPTVNNSVNPTTSFYNPYLFSSRPKELVYGEDTQCQILLNFSNELKRVDSTRSSELFCLDASNETDTPCGQSSALSYSHLASAVPVLLTVLLIVMTYMCH